MNKVNLLLRVADPARPRGAVESRSATFSAAGRRNLFAVQTNRIFIGLSRSGLSFNTTLYNAFAPGGVQGAVIETITGAEKIQQNAPPVRGTPKEGRALSPPAARGRIQAG